MTAEAASNVNAPKIRRTPGGRKTASRLRRYAGGDESEEYLAEARAVQQSRGEPGEDGGITAGLASIAAADGQKIVEIPTAATGPHPYNHPSRSVPQPGNSSWDELVESVGATGVVIPILLVTRPAFLAARPHLADAIGDAEYVVIYGHRRRAAALAAGRATIRAVVDDDVMTDNGDLDAMTLENLGREELPPLARAMMFAHYSDSGVPQESIAEKLGFDQGTVSRYLALMLLTPELQQAVEARRLKLTEAAPLANKLPYGPARPWQKNVDAEQATDQRRREQVAALELVVSGVTPKRAAERVVAERRARERAASDGVEIVDPRQLFGADFRDRQVDSPADSDDVVAAIDPTQGNLVYYSSRVEAESHPDDASAEQPKPSPRPSDDAKKARAAAAKARRTACPRLVAATPARDKLVRLLAAQYTSGAAALATSTAGWQLAHQWSRTAELVTGDHATPDAYRAAAATETDLRRQLEIAWACAVAGHELRAGDKTRDWDAHDLAYLELLEERAGYRRSAWESAQAAATAEAST